MNGTTDAHRDWLMAKDNTSINIESRKVEIYYSKKVLHHQIFTKIYNYHFFLSIPNLNFEFDTALEDLIQYLTQQ